MLLKKLVEIESPTGHEGELRNFVMNYLEEVGYEVAEGDYFISTKTKSDLIVATHLDTVAVKAPFSQDGVYAYGTGVCDAKASIAAILEAAEKGVDFTVAFFCDEEEGGRGSNEFVETWKHGRMAIVMEPTDLKIASKHYGSFDLRVNVRGKPCHASYPDLGLNAIERAFEVINELKKRFKATPLKIEGGSEDYIIPHYCRIKFDVLVEPEMRIEDALKGIEFLGRYGEYEVTYAYDGYISGNVVSLLEEAMKAAGINPEHTEMPSWTDALNLKDRYDVVVWGPGELQRCHTAIERVRLEDVARSRDVLLKLNEIFK
ncbi:M20/M25/M40 family metallo-hydrolase [Archaeoglobus neptunius]|uniref:M20/M25/M40 family metallo-hydrolase n=1 Tax=Archaeoglobus neptunius TaxID=2798580 RepID=UPI00192634BB|nr:M20/M25/M40 family metallo-hydrolase [Archaeoglobus neptunius]